jgi:hypothetical protein
MRKITLTILALCLASCGTTDNSGQSNITVVGNGTEPCPKADCVKHPADKDPR